MKILSFLLLASLLSTLPAAAQDGRKQRENCVWTVQGKLEDSDARMNKSGAPYDLIHFSAEQGDNPYIRLESTAFAPQLALFQVTENGYEFMESDRSPYEDRSELFPWIYEDGEYAIRVVPNMYQSPLDDESTDSEWPQRGYYTLQLSPVTCSS
ncbi:MAG: hypothetical protein AAFZ17_05945 [Cyanobacteria bacterium J06650_10]